MYAILKRNAERIRIFLMIVLVTLCTLCLFLFWGEEDQFRKDLCYEIVTGVMFTTLTICFISIFNWMVGRKEMEDAYDEKIAKYLIDLLRGRNIKDNLISSLYNEVAAREIMKNSVAYFNDILSSSYCALIENNEPVIRENFDYRVKMFKSDFSRNIILEQYLKYKRYFRISEPNLETCELKCCFTFSTTELNKYLEDNSFFLREEIQDKQLIAQIADAMKLSDFSEISKLLNLRIYLIKGKREDAIPSNLYEIEPIGDIYDLKGIIVKIKISSKSDYIKDDKGMMSYTGRVNFSIPIPETNRFYCVFADPIIGETKFSIEFDQDLIKDIHSVDFLQLLTIANKNNVTVTEPNKYQKEFVINETILPISGIVAFW